MQGFEYSVDIVMCIDATMSMKNALDMTKENALSFCAKVEEAMNNNLKFAKQVRVKVIVFRDYGVDAEPMIESDFFTVSGEVNDGEAFKEFVDAIQPSGGGDLPENSLEALALAMKSDWTTDLGKRRHIIVLFTDNEALKFGERSTSLNYPDGMPVDIAELNSWWQNGGQQFDGNIEPKNARLIVYAPEMYPWTPDEIGGWPRVQMTKVNPGEGLADTQFQEIIDMIVSSI